MLDAVGEVITALDGISDLSIESGMPETFFDGDGTSVFSTYTAVGWVDLADNSTRVFTHIGGAYRERISSLAIVVQFYTLSSEDAYDYSALIDEALSALYWKRSSCDTRKEQISDTQTAFRTIMRFTRKAFLTAVVPEP